MPGDKWANLRHHGKYSIPIVSGPAKGRRILYDALPKCLVVAEVTKDDLGEKHAKWHDYVPLADNSGRYKHSKNCPCRKKKGT